MDGLATTAVACKPANSNGSENARDDNMIKFCASNSEIEDVMKQQWLEEKRRKGSLGFEYVF